MTDLETLRKKVKEIDRDIINMIARRTELTILIGSEKERLGIPLRDWEVEKAVMDNARRISKELGSSPEFIISVMRLLIQESRIQQEISHFSDYKGSKENILIIGGLGEMGRWFSQFFRNQGHSVSIYDITGKTDEFTSFTDLDDAIGSASFICIATSLEEVPGVIDQVSNLGFEGTVFDIASLKGHLKHAVGRAKDRGIGITSIHPMFGPGTRTLSDKVICFCDCGDKKSNEKVEALFTNTAASRVRLSFDEHDKAMSYVLGLAHIINIIYIKILTEGGYSYGELKDIGSTTFSSQMATTSSVIKENPHLYYAIQQCNPFKEELYTSLKETVESLAKMILTQDKEAFVRTIEEGNEWVT